MAFNPHSPTPGKAVESVNGFASAFSGCQQCHGAKVALQSTDGGMITVDDLEPDAEGRPTNLDAVSRIVRDEDGRPQLHPGTWPNTGIGRLNLDGTRGSCTACHSRHDFSPRRARQPENCGKCHLGPDHPQKEIYETTRPRPPAPRAICRATSEMAGGSPTTRVSGSRGPTGRW